MKRTRTQGGKVEWKQNRTTRGYVDVFHDQIPCFSRKRKVHLAKSQLTSLYVLAVSTYLVSTAGLSSLRRAMSWLMPIGLWYAGCMITLDAVKSCSVPVISDCLWAPSLHGRKEGEHYFWYSFRFVSLLLRLNYKNPSMLDSYICMALKDESVRQKYVSKNAKFLELKISPQLLKKII